jgi:hypothetical protein
MFVVDVVLMIFQIMGSVQCSAIINSYATCKGFLSKLYKIRLYWFRNVTPLSAALISSGVLWFSSLTVSKIKLKTECYPSLQHTALTATTAFSSVTISKTNLIWMSIPFLYKTFSALLIFFVVSFGVFFENQLHWKINDTCIMLFQCVFFFRG